MKIEVLQGRCLKYELVGSRVTCDPAPMDTDQDVLVLSTAELWDTSLGAELVLTGFEKGGSDCGSQVDYLSQVPLSFQSFTLGDLNLIITFDREFYRRFLAATGVAKLLNLMSKDDRVMLFQAVLYGNDPRPAPMFELPPFKEYMRSWWVHCQSRGSRGCVEAMNAEEASRIGAEKLGGEITECLQLPYPADPRIHIVERDGCGAIPSFCFEPSKCKGHSSCPQRYSCTE